MISFRVSTAAALVAIAASVTPARAVDRTWFDSIDVNGMVSLGYTWNANRPITDLNGFRLFDEDVNTFSLDAAEVVIQRPVSASREVGFRLDLVAGSAIPEKTAAAGMALADEIDFQQGYVSYIAPIGNGLRFDAGKFVTHMGYELIEGYDGYNDHYSRSLLFNYAIPLTHTGIKASYSFTDRISAMVGVFNGWDNVEDNNNSKSIGANLTLKPFDRLAIYLNYIGGPEQATAGAAGLVAVGGNDVMRNVYDASIVWTPMDRLMLAVNYDYGTEDLVSNVVNRRDARWDGVAGYAKIGVSERFSIALRAEKFNDRDATRLTPYPAGIANNQPTDIREFTVTPAYKISENLLVRSDLRWDKANRNIFVKDNNIFVDDQFTVAANAIFTF